MATKQMGGGMSFPGNLATRGRFPKIPVSGASSDMEDGSLYEPGPVTIPAASVATLRATPYELVAAPGAGKVIQLVSGLLMIDYGTVAYTESADNLEIRYTNASGAIVSLLEMTGFITLTADGYLQVVPLKDVLLVANAKLVLFNNGDGEFGNSGDSPLIWKGLYRVLDV
jgi:hypothetical protein